MTPTGNQGRGRHIRSARCGLEEARNVAQATGLPPWWLNEQASAYVSTMSDKGKREVFDQPGIGVMAALPAQVFAMKAFAARGRDEDDLRALASILGTSSVEAAVDICRQFFPDEQLSSRSRAMLEDLFAS